MYPCSRTAQVESMNRGLHISFRYSWTSWTAIAPSPTAEATRLIEPERTSPTHQGWRGRFSLGRCHVGLTEPLPRSAPFVIFVGCEWAKRRLRFMGRFSL